MNNKEFFGLVPKVISYTIENEKIPAEFDGFKIAHISDTHSNPCDGIEDLIKENKPNIICITGDMLNDSNKSTDKIHKLFNELVKIAPVFFCSGNHDLWKFNSKKEIGYFTEHGGIFTDGKRIRLRKQDSQIFLSGITDPFSKIPSVIEKNIKASISMLQKGDGFNILLFHRANLFDLVKAEGYDLILSGHMHGGQIKLPILGGIASPTSSILSGKMLFPRYAAGRFDYKDTTMIVNSGSGNALLVPRLNNPPEVGIITLKSRSLAEIPQICEAQI